VTKRILLCDDEAHILRAAEFKFKRAGFDVRCASDGEEAWRRIEEEKPDILITDCQMPRLDGIGLVSRLRGDERFADLPVIMLTAKGLELTRSELLAGRGVLAIIGKPFSPRDLLQRVEEILAEAATV
jgi:DNA-binding response OmpR family regulator